MGHSPLPQKFSVDEKKRNLFVPGASITHQNWCQCAICLCCLYPENSLQDGLQSVLGVYKGLDCCSVEFMASVQSILSKTNKQKEKNMITINFAYKLYILSASTITGGLEVFQEKKKKSFIN